MLFIGRTTPYVGRVCSYVDDDVSDEDVFRLKLSAVLPVVTDPKKAVVALKWAVREGCTPREPTRVVIFRRAVRS